MKIYLYVLAALGPLLLLGLSIWWLSSWWTARGYEDRPPAEITEEDIIDQPHEPPSGATRIIFRDNPAVAVGVAPTGAKEEVQKFVEAAKDTTKPKRLAPVRVGYHDDLLRVTVGRSDGAFESAEFECEHGCDAWTRDSLIESRVMRAGFRFWPDLGRKVVKCSAVAAAGFGVGWAVNKLGDEVNREDEAVPSPTPDEDLLNPWLPAGVAGGACALLELTPG